MIGAAAPSDDREARQPCLQLAVMAGERGWITRVQLFGFIELGVALLGRVGAETTDAATPVTVFEYVRKVCRVSAVDHEIGDGPVGLVVDFVDRLPERLAVR